MRDNEWHGPDKDKWSNSYDENERTASHEEKADARFLAVKQDKKKIVLYPEQQAAKDKFLEWRKVKNSSQIFRIFGYAGTGKTTITKSITAEVSGRVVYGAYTGKAALVMARSGLRAQTLHSLIYKPVLPSKELAAQLEADLEEATNPTEIALIKAAIKSNKTIHFVINEDSVLKTASLLVLDECSMVNEEMATDLLSFGIPLLVLGDPGQLPPIKGTGALVNQKPDVLLETIHRQELDNPIINLSFKVRTGIAIKRGAYGDSRCVDKIKLLESGIQDLALCDQVLTGKNVTRRDLNQRIRKMHGNTGHYPVVGEKLICLRNNRALNLFNGLICTVTKILKEYDSFIIYEIVTEDDKKLQVKVLRAYFEEYRVPGTLKKLQWWDFQEAEEFDFGYAITVHKAQGSQWNNVILFDDKFFVWDRVQRKRWLYTAITRAVETITIAN